MPDFNYYMIIKADHKNVTTEDEIVAIIREQADTKHKIIGLKPSEDYYLCVYISNSEGFKKLTNEYHLKTNPGNSGYAPNEVMLQPAGEVLHNSLTLWWSKNTEENFTAYKIYMSETKDVSNLSSFVTEIKNKNINNFRVTGLKPYTAYYFKVYVENSFLMTSESNELKVITHTESPSPPVLSSPVYKNINSVLLEWSKETNNFFSSYEVYQAEGATNNEYKLISEIKDNTENSFRVNNLDINKEYFFKIKTTNIEGLYSFSNTLNINIDIKFIKSIGSYGPAENQFNIPWGIDEKDDLIYITEFNNKRISVYDTEGNFKNGLAYFSNAADKFNSPHYSAVSTNYIYTADSSNNRIVIMTKNGNITSKIGKNNGIGERGENNGEFNLPIGICNFNDEEIYVCDSYNSRVQVLNLTGKFLKKINITLPDNAEASLHGIGVTSDKSIYLTDTSNNFIIKYDSEGIFKKIIGNGTLQYPTAIYIDSNDNKYITDAGNNRIVIYDKNDNQIFIFGEKGNKDLNITHPTGICITDKGFIFIADSAQHKVKKFEIIVNSE